MFYTFAQKANDQQFNVDKEVFLKLPLVEVTLDLPGSRWNYLEHKVPIDRLYQLKQILEDVENPEISEIYYKTIIQTHPSFQPFLLANTEEELNLDIEDALNDF